MMSSAAVYRTVGLAAALVVASLVAQQLMTLLLGLVITVILSLPLSAAASRAQRVGLPRAVGALGALALVIGVLTGLGLLVIPEFVRQAKQFGDRLPAIVSDAERYVHALTGHQTRNLSTQLSQLVQDYIDHPQRLLGTFEQISVSAFVVIVSVVLVVLAAFLIAINPEALIDTSLRLLPSNRHAQAREIFTRVRTAWLGWIVAMAIDMLLLGGLLFAGMQLIGLQFALGFAVFSALLTVIPNYGSIISAIPPVLVGLATTPGKALLVLAVYVIVNQIEGNLILPLVMARTVDLHPALVAIGVLVMAALFGLIGVVIAIPLISLVIILVQTLWVEPNEALKVEPGGAVQLE